MTSVTSVACVLAGPVALATPHPHPDVQATSTVRSIKLRPDATAPAFVRGDAPSAASLLDDPVTSPTTPPIEDEITGVPGSVTIVDLADHPVGALGSSAAWFAADTSEGARLRVDLVARGAILGSRTVEADQSIRWYSIAFLPTSPSQVKNLQLRFTAVGDDGSASVRAAYAAVKSDNTTVVLRPSGDVKSLRVLPSGKAWAAIDDRLNAPGKPSSADYLGARKGGGTTTVGLPAPDLGDDTLASGKAWVHAQTGRSTKLVVELLSAGRVRAKISLPSGSGAGWRSVSFTPTTEESAELSLRFTAVGSSARVNVAYVDLRANDETADAINDYMRGLKPISDTTSTTDAVTGDTTTSDQIIEAPDQPSGKQRYRCTSTPHTLTTNPEQLVIDNPDASKLWLGSLLQGSGYSEGVGSIKELPIRKRAPLTVWIDEIGPNLNETVTDPTPAAMQDAIGRIVQRAKAQGTAFPYVASFNHSEQHSSTSALLKMSLSAKFLGASATAKLEMSSTVKENTALVTFNQRMFTVSVAHPAAPADLFSREFTIDDLREQERLGRISTDNPPVMITSIGYGQQLLYAVTSDSSAEKIAAAVKATYSGIDGDVSDDYKQIISHATTSVINIGGDEEPVRNLIKTGKVSDYFAGHSDPATARPISYQVDNVVTTGAAKFIEATQYNEKECQAIPNHEVVTGATLTLNNPTVYLGKGSSCSLYGSLQVNGHTVWNVDRSASRLQNIPLHTVASLQNVNLAPVNNSIDGLQRDWGQGLEISGTVNCWNSIWGDPVNKWDAGSVRWTLSQDQNPQPGQTLQLVARGNSAHAPVDVTLPITIKKLNTIAQP